VSDLPDLPKVTAVEAGGDFSLTLKTDGTIRAFGHNYYGQLGDGTLEDRNTPVQGGIIPLIQITASPVAANTATRGGADHLLYRIRLNVTEADATLTGLTLTTGGNYETSDIAEQGFTLRYSEDETLDTGDDPVLDTSETAPPSGHLRFSGFEQHIGKGTTGYLLITVNIGADPVPERNIFIKNTPLEQVQFKERNVFKSGDDPLAPGGEQTFPIITVYIESPQVSSSDVQQNQENVTLWQLNLSKTDGPEDAKLDGLLLTTRGTYLPSDIAGSFRLYYSGNNTLDPDSDQLISTSGVVPSGTDIEFTEIGLPVSGATAYLFVTADISATAGGARTLSVADVWFPDIRFAQNFLAKTGDNPANAGGTMAFPMTEITATASRATGTSEQSAADHILYHIELSVSNADTTLTSMTLTTGGTYEPSDIRSFRLYWSADSQLDPETDSDMATHEVVSPGEPLVFADLSRMIRQGTCHIFLTADIGDYAVARNIFVTETPLENLTFSDDVRFGSEDALAAGGEQTFPTPAVAVISPAVPAVTVEQDTRNHPLYQISLGVSHARAVLTRASFSTAGTYQISDIDRFTLRYSEDAALDDQDIEIGSYDVFPAGTEMVFENISQTIEKGTTGHIFLTADIGAANGARTVSITETVLEALSFREPGNLTLTGTMGAGAVQTFPVPAIAMSSPLVPAAEIEQEIPNLVLCKVKMDITRAEAVLNGVTLTTQGDYQKSDMDGDMPFELRYSEDDFLDNQDPPLGTKSFVSPGTPLEFTGISRSIPKGTTGYLFLTADIGRANGARTISVQSPGLSQFVFEFGDKTGTMAAGGVQTFPVPSILITAPEVRPGEAVQETEAHILYRLNLGITRAEAVLKSLTLKTQGSYLTSDLMSETPFRLRYSVNDTLNAGDATLGTRGFVSSGGTLDFTELSQLIDKGRTVYLFVTADIGEAVGRHISISGMPFANITFEFGDKLGDSPTVAGGVQQFPVPRIEITSSAVPSSTVEPKTVDFLLYRLDMGVTKADAILESLTLTPTGTYRDSDIRTDCSKTETCDEASVFKLWHSEDDILGEGDPVIKEALFVQPDTSLAFTGLSQVIEKGTTGHLFVTVNVGPSTAGRTIRVSETPFDNMIFSYREK
ncbi:MAG: hypothetical protein DRI57_23685, partial [Deltaproteobacteria bacterium]